MKIAVIQGTTQADKNIMLYECVKQAVSKYDYEVINFGVKPDEQEKYSYTEIAFLIALLINSGVVDFVVTGCSSGQGMNLACNMMPKILSGFIQNPQDAFLYGRINGGNVASLSLGLGFGWLGELNLRYTLEKLFDGEFGVGYPKEAAKRKVREAKIVKNFNFVCKREIIDVMNDLDKKFMEKVLSKKDVIQYIIDNSNEERLIQYLLSYV